MLLITCQAGADRFAIPLRHVVEVVPRAILQRPGGLPDWLAGILVYRGTATPVLDLTWLTHGTPCPNRLSSRILLLRTNWQDAQRRFGLLAEHVALNEVDDSSLNQAEPAGGPTALGTLRLDSHGVFQLLDLDLLLPDQRREVLFAAAEESPT